LSSKIENFLPQVYMGGAKRTYGEFDKFGKLNFLSGSFMILETLKDFGFFSVYPHYCFQHAVHGLDSGLSLE